jgi:hypothetical protein
MKVVRKKYESGEHRPKPFKKGEQLKLGFE